MSDDPQGRVQAEVCGAFGAAQARLEAHPVRDMKLGALEIERALPVRERRLIGAWCFLDRFGPLSFSSGRPMDVAPHPHIGLQTVTWLLEGEVAHEDSLGCEAIARPGGVNVMTAGRGIAHAEWTPDEHGGRLSGVQLWVALPAEHRAAAPAFEHVATAPVAELRGGRAHVFAGALAGIASPARYFTPLVGAELVLDPGRTLTLPLEAAHEHGLLVLTGDVALEGQPLAARALWYLGVGRTSLDLRSEAGARLLLLGGPPFPETILMWWNFVARTPEEIAEAHADWEQHRRFGELRRYPGPRLTAPPLQRLARPNPMS
jgi:redox-sensitive bicupin YhaK (pirin superfamily)